MELRVLNYFLAIAREENITKAAQILHVTQPTFSRQIAQLEEELGVKLFQRSNHHIILTEDGMILKRRAQEMMSLAEKTRMDLSHSEQALTGQIAIGSGEFQSTEFLSSLINAFNRKHPLVRFSIYSGNAANIRDRIERGLLDIGLMSEPIDIGKYEFITTEYKEKWGVLVKNDSDLIGKKSVTPEDLRNRPLIISSGESVKLMLSKWFETSIENLNIVADGNLLYNLAMLVSKGIGTVICIRLNCTYKDCTFIPLSPAVEAGSVLGWKKDQSFSRATSAFLNFAKTYSKSISGDSI